MIKARKIKEKRKTSLVLILTFLNKIIPPISRLFLNIFYPILKNKNKSFLIV